MNYTGDRRSVLTLAHELGHGLHGYLAEPLGLFNASSPLTTAETASVFGEALTFKRLLALEEDPHAPAQPAGRADRGLDRDGVPADRDEPLRGRRAHDAPRRGRAVAGALRGALAARRRRDLFGDSVDIDGYATWWSYIPHFIGTPGLRLRLRVRLPLRALDLPQVRARGRLARRAVPRRAARRRVEAAARSSPRWSVSTSPIRRSGTAGIDALAVELDEAEALAGDVGL